MAGLAPRPALTKQPSGLLRQGESALLVGRPGSGRRSLVRLALHDLLTNEFEILEDNFFFLNLPGGEPGELPEFLNRMTEVIVFRPLKQETLRQVALRELRAVSRLAASQGLSVGVEPAVATFVAAACAGSPYGAREVQRVVRRLVVDAIADQAASGSQRRLRVSVTGGAIVVSEGGRRVLLPAGLRRGTPAVEKGHARVAAERLRSLRRDLVREPARQEWVQETVRLLIAFGRTAYAASRPDLARKFLNEALAVWTRHFPEGDCPPDLALEVASSHLGLCVLARDAEEEARHLVGAVRFLGRTPGNSTRSQRLWAVAREALGQLGGPG